MTHEEIVAKRLKLRLFNKNTLLHQKTQRAKTFVGGKRFAELSADDKRLVLRLYHFFRKLFVEK